MNKSLRQGVQEYLEYRWKLGFQLTDSKNVLNRFVKFMESIGAEYITIDLALTFSTINPSVLPSTWAAHLGVIRRFAKYWFLQDPRTEIPSKNLLPRFYIRKRPYIYSKINIVKIMQCLSTQDPMDQYTCSMLFGLLAVTGIRIAEAIALERDAIDLQNGVIIIRRGKFRKSRYIPIHKTTAEALREYAVCRDHHILNQNASSFFVHHEGLGLKADWVRNNFNLRLRKLGLKKPVEGRCPRIMDLRHTFVIRALTQWYKKRGGSIDQCVPLLSTYLGHVRPTNTYWYVTATPELLGLILSKKQKNRGEV